LEVLQILLVTAVQIRQEQELLTAYSLTMIARNLTPFWTKQFHEYMQKFSFVLSQQ